MSDLAARLAHCRPPLAEALAAAGAPMAVVFAAIPIITDALIGVLAGPAPADGSAVPLPDWRALATRAGEPVDLPAWQEHERALPYHSDESWRPAQPGLEAE